MPRNDWLALAAFALAACSVTAPYVDVAEPKVYTEDDTLRFLAERRRELDKLATTISAAELQEVHGIRERTSTQVDLALGRKSGDIVEPGDPPQAEQSLPPAPTSTVGLTYSELLQRQITRAQEFAAYDLLYLGDQWIQDQTHRVYMLRLDVSVNASLDCGSTPQFVIVELEVQADSGQPRIYALMPEFSAATAKETWIASVLSDYGGSLAYPIGSFDASVSGRLQKELEESFERLVQQPLQFALYQSTPGACAFAIGPRRKLERRSWANPARWFGSTYRIDYEIRPGPRACMALVTVPHLDKPVNLTIRRSLVTKDGSEEIKSDAVFPPQPRLFTSEGLNDLRTARSDRPVRTQAQAALAGAPAATMPHSSTVVTLPARMHGGVNKLTFTPKTGGSLLALTERPIGSATRAFLGDVAVPLANTHVLGARRLLIDIPKNDALEARRAILVKAKGMDEAKEYLRLVTPGGSVEEIEVLLLEGPSAAPSTEQKSLWAASPATGPGPLQVRLQPTEVVNASFAAAVRKVEALLAAGRVEVSFTHDPQTSSISVALPAANQNKRAFVDFWITREVAGKAVVDMLPRAFRYDL